MKKKFISIFLTILTIFSIYFLILFFLKSEPKIEINDKKIEIENNFKVEEKKGIIILNLKGGNSYQKGLFQGKELEKEIKELLTFFKKNMLGKDYYFGGPIYSTLQNKAKNFIKYIPQKNLEEMKGIADGAKINFNEILLLNTYDDLLQIAGCSSMAIPKKDNFNEYFIHTRNLDYPIKILAKNKVILKYDTHISVGFPGYIGVLTGIGEKGISLSNHTSYSKNKSQYGIPSGLLYRKIIENSSKIKDAKNILKKEKRTIANNLMIGSYKENSAIIAEIDSKTLDFRNNFSKNILVSTNHFRTEKMKEFSTSGEGKRYNQYFDKISKIKKVEVKNIEKILAHYKKTKYRETISNNGTIQSVIMIPELRKIFVANGKTIPVSKGKYIEIDF